MTPFLWDSISGNAWRAEIELRFPRENFQVRLRDVEHLEVLECSPMSGVLPDAEYIAAFRSSGPPRQCDFVSELARDPDF